MRRVLKGLGISLAVLVVLIGTLYWFRVELILAYMHPPEEFRAQESPPAPDYSLLQSWAAHPGVEDPSDLRRPGDKVRNNAKDVDVFYLHPTTYLGPGGWNSLLRPDEASAENLQTALAGQASVFNDCCRVYAPHYRQAHLAAFSIKDTAAVFDALDLAYQDIARAFDYFLEHYNADRPFIVAGHSQGSLHAIRLLEEAVHRRGLQDRMVVAYPIGYWVPADKLERGLGGIGLCESADQLGCFVAWDTYGDSGEGRDIAGELPYWYNSGWEQAQTDRTLCVNPLSWKADTERVSAGQHLGGLPIESLFSVVDVMRNRHTGRQYDGLPESVPELTWAECHSNGTLFIESQTDNAFSVGVNESQMYHNHDWPLFYQNLRQNVEHRIRRYMTQADSR